VVASGILLDLNQGLLDPCEHEKFDVTSGLSVQQRENLTKTAQHYLRMMHFRQIHKVNKLYGTETSEYKTSLLLEWSKRFGFHMASEYLGPISSTFQVVFV
jgi:hypothetical protein